MQQGMEDGMYAASESDPISPVEIVHEVDGVFIDGKLTSGYNYLVYHFEKYGAYMWTRTYLDEAYSVNICGPFNNRTDREDVDAPELRSEVLAYLRRRFPEINELGPEGFEPVDIGDD